MKKQLLITSVYVKNEAGENMVKSALKSLISEFDVCMATHSPLSKDIQSMLKYYIYDHRNEIIQNHPSFHVWADYPSFYFKSHHVSHLPNPSYAIYKSYMNAVHLLSDYYDDFVFLEGDCIFSPEDVEKLKNFKSICEKENKDAFFFVYPEMLSTLFFYSKMSFFKECFPILKTPEEYLNYCDKIGSWRSLENFMFKCVEHKNALNRIHNGGNKENYFDKSLIGLTSSSDAINGCIAREYTAYILNVENTDEIAFLYICDKEGVSEEMDVLLDGEKIYTIPKGIHANVLKINPKNEDFFVKIGDNPEIKYNKTFIFQNRNVTYVRIK